MSTVSAAIWSGNGREILYVPYSYRTLYGPEKQWNEAAAHKFFLDHWYSSIYIAVAYVLVVHLMERCMKERKAFQLKGSLVVWNSSLALFSIIATYRFSEEFLHTLTTRPLLDSVCYSVNPTEPAAFWGCAFVLSKVLELGDTVFVVLRKRPLIFLHWYHHAVVLVYSWHGAVELTAAARWFIMMNYTVHSVMYTYYAIVSGGYRLPKWLSMFVTTLQTTQMLFGVLISFAVLGMKLTGRACQQSSENLILCFAIYASFAVLFMKFFKSAYLTPKKKAE